MRDEPTTMEQLFLLEQVAKARNLKVEAAARELDYPSRTVALATILDAAISHEHLAEMYDIQSVRDKARELRDALESIVGQ